MSLADVPLTPDGGQARQWLLDELAKPAYAEAQPTLFDRISTAVLGWFTGLFKLGSSGFPPILIAAALLLVVIVVVVALLLFGLPRRNRRSAVGALFGEDDRRTAADLRRSAEQAAARGDWRLAVLERFRAIARGLDERTLVAVFPGTTASTFARSAAAVAPAERDELAAAARLFDGVRYADLAADRDDATRLAALDGRLAAVRPHPAAPVSA